MYDQVVHTAVLRPLKNQLRYDHNVANGLLSENQSTNHLSKQNNFIVLIHLPGISPGC